MSRQKSQLLSAYSIARNIFQAVVDAILRAGGDDDDVRLIEKRELADQIAALVMAYAKKPKPVQDTAGLEVFEIEVDGDDPRWSKIEPSKYVYCNDSARTGDFPVKPGRRIVKYVLLPFAFDGSNQQVIDDTISRNLTRPDRAITETILDARKDECAQKPIIGVCGVVQSGTDGRSIVGGVYEGAGGRYLGLYDLHGYWNRSCQFVAVVSE